MDGFDRIYDLHRILKGRKAAISTKDILGEMECSRATFNRIKRHMTDFLGAPIEYDREQGGYRYVESSEEGFELPGIWFNEKELHSLLLIQQLLTGFGVSVLKEEIYPIQQRINQLLKQSAIEPAALQNKIRFLGVAIRDVDAHQFQPIAEAILKSQRLSITYTTRDDGFVSRRDISPQRLINYRNNWFLDAWCHKRDYYRTFAMECISDIKPSTEPFKVVDEQDMDRYFRGSYGIYAGDDIGVATIRFKPEIAQRISEETWHSGQKGQFNSDGSYELSLPFNVVQPHELIMDVARFGDKAEIVSPQSLRNALCEWLAKTLAIYE